MLLTGWASAIDYNPDGTITPDIDWYVKNIKEARYELKTANELAGLAALVNGTTGFFSPYDFTGKTVVLANDIDMESYVDDSNSSIKGGKWIPIGINYSARFAGVFDGQGYAIKNLVVRNTKAGTLFGYSSGTIKNLVIAGGMVCADFYGAGICSHNSGTVDHCINTANIYCNNYGGGIVGKNYGEGRITNCINIGYVQNGRQCGGVVGSNAASGTFIYNCVYDAQMCPLKRGCGNIDNKNIKGLPTAQIILGLNFDKTGYTIGNGLYPMLEVSTPNDALRTALSPVKLADGQTVASVNKTFEIETADGVEYTSSIPTFLTIDGKKCEPKANAHASIVIKGGNCVRYVNLKLSVQHGVNPGMLNIATYKDLKQFANAVNNRTNYKGYPCIDGFKDVTFAIQANIYIPKNETWEPIGTLDAPFNGTFIGYGYVIANMKIMRPLDKYCGLFGYNNGSISKVCLVDGHVIGSDYTGAVCGYNAGVIEKCINTLPVRGRYYSGGICGYNNGGQIRYCLDLNSTEGIGEYTGAICGGGLGGIVASSFYDTQLCPESQAIGDNELTQTPHLEGRTTKELTGDKLKGKPALDLDFIFTDKLYPRIISSAPHTEALVASTPINIGDSDNLLHVMSFIELYEIDSISYQCLQKDVMSVTDDKIIPHKQGSVVFTITDGKVRKDLTMRIVNPALEAVGTVKNPLLIRSYDDLCKFRDAVNLGTDYKGFACIDGFADVHFKITDDISCPSNTNQLPIGNILSPFKGILDGNKKTIFDFNCDFSKYDNVGFVGYNIGLVKNVRLAASNIKGNYYTGGICGYNLGRIEDCRMDSSEVSGANYCGGICGYDGGEISRCINSSSVHCDYYVGGICGSNSGRIDSCTNSHAGRITGQSSVGGITGSNNAEVNFCTNLATIAGKDNTGGISGRNSFSQIVNCNNKGEIDGGDCSGGVVGFNDGNVTLSTNESDVVATYAAGGIVGKGGKVAGCTNNGKILSKGNNAGGIIGVTKSTSDIKLSTNYGVIEAQAFVGGICSDNVQGNIASCISYGKIAASYYVGGIVGYNTGHVESSIFIGEVEGSSYFGSICGRENDGQIERCVYDKQVSSIGGIDNKDVASQAIGYETHQLKSGDISGMMNKDEFIYSESEYPVPNTNNIPVN